MMAREIWLDRIHPNLRDMALAALANGDVEGFLGCADNLAGLLRLHKPAVYTITVKEADVLAYTNGRNEEEFIILPWSIGRPQLEQLPPARATNRLEEGNFGTNRRNAAAE